MLKSIVSTTPDIAATVARLGLAVVIFPHGAQKVLGWFGGNGFSGTMNFFTENMGLPWIVALLVVLGEFLGPIGLAVGALARPAAAGIAIIMVGAAQVHWVHGFFMNWYGNQQGEGFEYHLLAITLAVVVAVKGAGAYSIDRWLQNR
ncbi:MAG: DoxX family protein [Acidobacteriota bacterium]